MAKARSSCYVKLPIELINRIILELSLREKNVFLAILTFYNYKSQCAFPSNDKLLEMSGICSMTRLSEIRRRLKMTGILDYELRKGGAKYTIPALVHLKSCDNGDDNGYRPPFDE